MKNLIENILKTVSDEIYHRGFDYYKSNKIIYIEHNNNIVSAGVEGSNGEIYEVLVDFDKNGNVKFYDCDCPYDGGSICKHIVAVLLKLSQNNVTYDLPLEEILESLTKEKLIKIIAELANKDYKIKDKIYNRFALTLNQDIDIEDILDNIIYDYSDSDGFVNYYMCYDMCMEIDAVVNDEFDLYKSDSSLQHIKNLLSTNRKIINLIGNCDDSDGGISIILYDIEKCLFTACESVLKSKDEKKCVEFLNIVCDEVKNEAYDEWLDSKYVLLNIAVELSKYNKNIVLKLLDDFIKQCEQKQEYYLGKAILLKHKFIGLYENEKSAQEFLNCYINIDDICEYAVEKYISEKKYDEAEKLCVKKLKSTTFPNRWKSLLSSVYEKSKQFDKQLEIELDVLLSGNANSYPCVKKLMKELGLWNENRKALLEKLSQKLSVYNYADILKEEKEYDKLLNLVQTHHFLIKSYFSFIAVKHTKEAYEMYFDFIIYTAEISSSRKEYQLCCEEISTLYNAGGTSEAKRLVMFLKNKYPRKPAFLDELNKLKL